MAAPRAADTFIEIARFFIVLLFTALGYQLGHREPQWLPHVLRVAGSAVLVVSMLGAAVGYVVGGVFGRFLQRVFGAVEERVERAPAPQMAAGAAGGLVGLAFGVLVTMPLFLLLPPMWAVPIGAFVVWVAVTFGYRVARNRSADLLRMMGLSGGFAPRDYPERQDIPGILVDTSAVIDGRLLGVSRAGFLETPLLVPRFVIEEVQAIADSSDRKRRRQGRRGLEILDALRLEIDMVVIDDELPEVAEVDAKLVRLARRLGVPLLTTDYNLQKVAEVQGIDVCNINRLVEAVRPPVVPGDRMRLRIEVEGSQEHQGVGYAEDGTMVVVSDAEGSIGEVIEAIVTSAHQTSAGRMLFARRVEPTAPDDGGTEVHTHVDAVRSAD